MERGNVGPKVLLLDLLFAFSSHLTAKLWRANSRKVGGGVIPPRAGSPLPSALPG
jgi:hypothetical protein